MANPLVETKLYLPRLRRSLVARPRLSGRLRRGSDARLTLISAPAGFGKTTLLAAWLAAATTATTGRWRGSPSITATANPPRSGPT